MDVELASVITAISKNKSLKHLTMSRNLLNMKTKNIGTVMDALVQMIQEEDCVLETLNIPDSKLKTDLYNLMNALGSNHCLQTIDIRFISFFYIYFTLFSNISLIIILTEQSAFIFLVGI